MGYEKLVSGTCMGEKVMSWWREVAVHLTGFAQAVR